jgi:hypothetical protein
MRHRAGGTRRVIPREDRAISGPHNGVGRRPKGSYFRCAFVAIVLSVRTHSGVSSDQMPGRSCQGSISVRQKTGQFRSAGALGDRKDEKLEISHWRSRANRDPAFGGRDARQLGNGRHFASTD